MKTYVKLTIDKLNKLIAEHPDADVIFDSSSCSTICGCKFLESDICYVEKDNIIYIG